MYRNVIFPRFTFATKIVLLYIIMASEVLLHFDTHASKRILKFDQ